ncbi:MAG TPA: methyltransferase domain-containing protein [Alkalispirochaeta sp.]|nr:methyltransferase domain-containing protein [Alkalispirochaeta sp.]
MDFPDADETLLIATVRQFRTINRLVSRSRSLIRRHILRDAQRRGLSQITVLDVGAGGCDIGVWIAAAAARYGIEARVICLDQDPRIIAYARECTAQTPRVEVVEGSAAELDHLGPVDYIFANHFLHHLPDEVIVELLPQLARTARYGYVLNDLRRSRLSYVGYSLLAGLFFRGSFAYYDGRLSIRRGFTKSELRRLVGDGGQAAAARVVSLTPGRLAVVAHRPGGGSAFPGIDTQRV